MNFQTQNSWWSPPRHNRLWGTRLRSSPYRTLFTGYGRFRINYFCLSAGKLCLYSPATGFSESSALICSDLICSGLSLSINFRRNKLNRRIHRGIFTGQKLRRRNPLFLQSLNKFAEAKKVSWLRRSFYSPFYRNKRIAQWPNEEDKFGTLILASLRPVHLSFSE